MRRWALLGTLLLLSGCSGLGKFFFDTARLPGQNPNATTGVSENLQRSRGQDPVEAPLMPESGNVWPGPPQPLPTLSDVSRSGGQFDGPLGATGPAMKSGSSMSLGEQTAISHGAPLDDSGFAGGSSGSGTLSKGIADPSRKYRGGGASSGSGGGGGGGGGNIVIPNGDGTSTVISPDGSVKTVKGTPK